MSEAEALLGDQQRRCGGVPRRAALGLLLGAALVAAAHFVSMSGGAPEQGQFTASSDLHRFMDAVEAAREPRCSQVPLRRGNSTLKIAFLFLLSGPVNRASEAMWKRFFAGAHQKQYSVLVHSTDPVPAASYFSQYATVPPVENSWRRHLRARLSLLRQALLDPCIEKLVWLSGSDIPIKSFSFVYNELVMKSSFSMISYSNINPVKLWGTEIPISLKNSECLVLARRHASCLVEERKLARSYAQGHLPPTEHFPAMVMKQNNMLDEITGFNVWLVLWVKEESTYHPHTFSNLHADYFAPYLVNATRNPRLLFARKIGARADLKELDPGY